MSSKGKGNEFRYSNRICLHAVREDVQTQKDFIKEYLTKKVDFRGFTHI